MTPAPYFAEIADDYPAGQAHWLDLPDGIRIRIATWGPDADQGTVLLFPGRTEYAEKYAHTAAALAKAGYATLSVDWRGQGVADRMLGDPIIGHVGTFADFQIDVQGIVAAAKELDLPKPWFLIGHSMGGCIGLRALYNQIPVAGAVFTGPMWGISLNAAERPAAWAVSWVSRKLGLSGAMAPGQRRGAYVSDEPFEDNCLTTDPAMYRWMQDHIAARPELSLGGPSLNWLHEALAETLALSRLPSPDLPCQTFLGGRERVVDPQRIRDRMAAWPKGQLVEVPGAEHEVLMEAPEIRDQALSDILRFFAAVKTGQWMADTGQQSA